MKFENKDSYAKESALENKRLVVQIFRYSIISTIIILCITVAAMIGCPKYKVYQQGKEGEAELKRAEQNRQIKIQEAQAVRASASELAAADTIRAHGIARSQEIIGAKLTPEYLQWFFIDNLEKNQNAVFYIPTEASIPIMESGRAGNSLRK